jgi:integrase
MWLGGHMVHSIDCIILKKLVHPWQTTYSTLSFDHLAIVVDSLNNAHIFTAFSSGSAQVNRLVKTDLEDFQIGLIDEDLSPSYIDQIIGSARTSVNKAVGDRKVSGDCLYPFRKLGKLLKKNANARNLIWTMEQYEAVIAKASRRLKPILATGYWTGMREDEILSLVWWKVDMKGRWIKLEPADTKDNEPRLIPILPPLYEILEKIPRAIHDEHVFLYRGSPVKDIRTALYNAIEAAGVPYGRNTRNGLIFHDLRHTYVTNMRRAGVDESTIMKITGHSTREMFDRYNLVDETDADVAAERMMEYMTEFQQKDDAESL